MQSLQERISGRVVHRGDHAYEQVRRAPGWNEIKPERYPDLIVQVASEDDVIEAVNFARAQRMKISIRGGGHNWCAAALQEGGILLDLSRLNQVEIDSETRVATLNRLELIAILLNTSKACMHFRWKLSTVH